MVRREQEKYVSRLKTAVKVNYDTVKGQAGAEVSNFEVSSLGFFFRSQQLTYEIVYTCIGVISSERGYNGNYETPKRSMAVGNFDK